MTFMLQKIRSIFRHFGGSILISLLALIFVYIYMGWQAALLTLALMVIEITFSFDNAIVNAKVLMTMSKFWQNIFMTIGILIAVFGMRIVFPIVIVMVTAGLPWNDVINLALNDQEAYAAAINEAHTSIAAFGGMFLLMLALHFFFDHTRKTLWFPAIEKRLLSIGKWWMSAAISLLLLCIVTFLPFNAHPGETFVAGIVGILTYLGIFGLSAYFTKRHEASEKKAGKKLLKTGMAGFSAFIYLEILDASFSLDGVIGAFAVTQNVVLIAIGLGVGAVWVRSMTLYMVRKKILHAFRFLEHGAHYTIALLAIVLLLGLFFAIPEAVAGVFGVLIIGASVIASKRAEKKIIDVTDPNQKVHAH